MARPTNKKYAMNMSETQYKLMEDTRELIEAVTNAETVRRALIYLEYLVDNEVEIPQAEVVKERLDIKTDLVYDARTRVRLERLSTIFNNKSDAVRTALYVFNQAYKTKLVL